MSWVAFAAVATATNTGRLARWCALALATHLFLHGAARIAGSIGSRTIAPGVATGALLCVPASIAVWRSVALSRNDRFRGALAGLLSFQPLIHAALHLAQRAIR